VRDRSSAGLKSMRRHRRPPIALSQAYTQASLPPRDPYKPSGLLSLGKPGQIDGPFREGGFSRVGTTKVMAAKRFTIGPSRSTNPRVSFPLSKAEHTKRIVRHSRFQTPMTAPGQNAKSLPTVACQLSPPADMGRQGRSGWSSSHNKRDGMLGLGAPGLPCADCGSTRLKALKLLGCPLARDQSPEDE
jgi:hypothetical protein